MKYFKTKGLIYKIKDMHDSSKLIWVLTINSGKISSIAKGVKKINSKRRGHIDIFNYNEFTFYKGKNLDILTETTTINSFENIKHKFIYEIFYLCELINLVYIDNSEARLILKILVDILKQANEDNFKVLINFFEMKLLTIIGYEPNLTTFLDTEEKFSETDKFYLSKTTPGYLSKRKNTNKIINPTIIKCQRFFLKNYVYAVLKLKVSEEIQIQIDKIQKIWLQSVFEKKFRTIKFINM